MTFNLLSDRRNNALRPCTLVLLGLFVVTGCGTKFAPAPSTQSLPPPLPQSQETLPRVPDTLPNLPESNPPPVIRPTTTTAPDEPVRSLPAAITLREQASRAADADNHLRAIGLLERAIRISPQDPTTFEALAESHLALNRPGQALQLVRRGLSLNPTPEQRNSLMLLAEKCQALL